MTFLEAVALRVVLEETGICREDESPAAPLLGFPSSGDSASSEQCEGQPALFDVALKDYPAVPLVHFPLQLGDSISSEYSVSTSQSQQNMLQ